MPRSSRPALLLCLLLLMQTASAADPWAAPGDMALRHDLQTLADAGVLEGKRFTAHCSVHAELPGALGEERVVEDGALITSRGAGTAVEFGLVLVKHLFGEAKAREVSDSIMF